MGISDKSTKAARLRETRMGVKAMSETDNAPENAVEADTESAKETDWKAEARKWEARAKENLGRASHNEEAAKRLADLEEANKTEAEKVAARLEAAETRAAELEAKAVRAEVAAAKGVPAALLTGSTQEELEAAADALIAFRGEQKQAPKSEALSRVNSNNVKASTGHQFADFFESQLN